MLVLARKSGQRVIVREGANRVVITVLGIQEGKVRLGIEAPDDVRVDREEVALRREPEKECACV